MEIFLNSLILFKHIHSSCICFVSVWISGFGMRQVNYTVSEIVLIIISRNVLDQLKRDGEQILRKRY